MILSIIIIAKNAEVSIEKAIKSVAWASEIIVVDNDSSDKTISVSKKLGAKIISSKSNSFSELRNMGLKTAGNNWLFYLDSDEIVTNQLAEEIQDIVEKNILGVWKVIRENYFLGTKMYPDQVERLFHKEVMTEWRGNLHESSVYDGDVQMLKNCLIHHTHTNITSMLDKTNKWSEVEAELRLNANHPPVSWWRLIRIYLTVFWQQFVRLKIWKYGRSGIFEGYFQMIDKLIVYTKLWEMQNGENSE